MRRVLLENHQKCGIFSCAPLYFCADILETHTQRAKETQQTRKEQTKDREREKARGYGKRTNYNSIESQ